MGKGTNIMSALWKGMEVVGFDLMYKGNGDKFQITNLTNVATQSFGGGTYTITAEPEVFGTPVSSKTQAESTFGGAAATVFQGGSSANTIPGYAGLQTVPNNASWAISNPNSSIDQLISDEVLTPEGVPIEAEAPPILPVTSLSTFETSAHLSTHMF